MHLPVRFSPGNTVISQFVIAKNVKMVIALMVNVIAKKDLRVTAEIKKECPIDDRTGVPCHGNGPCKNGKCICNEGYTGKIVAY